jgi:hypothetical protein
LRIGMHAAAKRPERASDRLTELHHEFLMPRAVKAFAPDCLHRADGPVGCGCGHSGIWRPGRYQAAAVRRGGGGWLRDDGHDRIVCNLPVARRRSRRARRSCSWTQRCRSIARRFETERAGRSRSLRISGQALNLRFGEGAARSIQHGLLPGERLLALHSDIDIGRVQLDGMAGVAGHLGGNDPGT